MGKNVNPGALAGATGADFEAGSFNFGHYTAFPTAATLSTRRARHLALRFGVPSEKAGLMATLVFGEGRA